MTYELRIERLIDATPEVVFDAFLDPDAQKQLYGDETDPSWTVESELDLRVGGTWTIVFGPSDGTSEPDRITYVFTEIDRPRRLVHRMSMLVREWGRTVDLTETITFDEQDGKTLFTIVQSGFETEEDRDAYLSGVPGFLDALQQFVEEGRRQWMR